MSNEPTPSSEQPTENTPESVEAHSQDESLPETEHPESDQPNEVSMDADSTGTESMSADSPGDEDVADFLSEETIDQLTETQAGVDSDTSDAAEGDDETESVEDSGDSDSFDAMDEPDAESESVADVSAPEEVSDEGGFEEEPESLTDVTMAAAETVEETGDSDGGDDFDEADAEEFEGEAEPTAEAKPSAPSPAPSSPPAPKAAPTSTLGKVKAGTVWVLQTIYQGLDWVFVQLKSEAQPEDSSADDQATPSSPSAAKKIEGVLAQVLKTVAIALTTALSFVIGAGIKLLGAPLQPAAAETASQPSLIGGIASTLWGIVWPILKQLWRLWRRVLAILRERLLPTPIKPLTDVTLTIVAVGIVYSLSWLTSAISPEPKAPPVAASPPIAVSTDAQPANVSPVIAKRIATIQEDLSEATRSYGDDLVQMVQIISGGDRLTVTLDWDWYRLNSRQQDQLSKALLKTAQDLDFESLEVLDIDGTRVARSPVIGSTMIVFERTSEKLEEFDRIAAEKAAAEKAAAEKAAAEKAAAEKAAAEKAAAEKADAEKELDINSDASSAESSVSPVTLEGNES